MGIITVSRTHGSGGTTFARELAKRLDYLFINRTLISNDCRENNTHVCAFGIDNETTPGFHGATQELMTDVNFYKGAPADIQAATARTAEIPQELDQLFARWGELEA